MDFSKNLSDLRELLLGLAGLSEKDVSSFATKVEFSLGKIGMDQSTFSFCLLAVAGLLFVSLVMMMSRRNSSSDLSSEVPYSDDRIGELEQSLHDIKTQLAIVKSQSKADFEFLKQDMNELKHSQNLESSVTHFDEPEDRSLAAND